MTQIAELPAASFDSANIFSRLIDAEEGTLPKPLAEFVLSLKFSSIDHARYEQLSEKAQDGTLTVEEGAQLDNLIHVNALLGILRLKAKRSLSMDL